MSDQKKRPVFKRKESKKIEKEESEDNSKRDMDDLLRSIDESLDHIDSKDYPFVIDPF